MVLCIPNQGRENRKYLPKLSLHMQTLASRVAQSWWRQCGLAWPYPSIQGQIQTFQGGGWEGGTKKRENIIYKKIQVN